MIKNNITINLITNKSDCGKRIDQYLSQNTDLSRQRITDLISDKAILLNNNIVTQKNKKLNGEFENIKITIPPLKTELLEAENIPINIMYEDDDLLVIDKQPNLVVHPGAGVNSGTLVNAIMHHCGDRLSGIGGHLRPGIVHRLDKDTSGLMLIAKNDKAHLHLSQQFQDHGRTGKLERIYLAFVWGVPKLKKGRIETQLSRSDSDRTKISVTMNPEKGRKAITDYQIIEKYHTSNNEPLASLIRCKLYTGRTHQIRVHLDHIGNPVVCDKKYGKGFITKTKMMSENCRTQLLNLDRHALHSSKISFLHPSNNEIMTFEAALPLDLVTLKNILSEI